MPATAARDAAAAKEAKKPKRWLDERAAAKTASDLHGCFSAYDPNGYGSISMVEAIFCLKDLGALEGLPAEAVADELRRCGAPTAGSERATAMVTPPELERYAKELARRRFEGGDGPEATAVPPRADGMSALRRRFTRYTAEESRGRGLRMRAGDFECFLHEGKFLRDEYGVAPGDPPRATVAVADVIFVKVRLCRLTSG